MNDYDENNENFYCISLCEVILGDKGPMAKRLADLNENNEFEIFVCNPQKPKNYANRLYIYLKDGPNQPGKIGVWEWSAEPNLNDKSRDYINARYRADIVPVEVVEISNTITAEAIVNMLKKGIEFELKTEKVLFAVGKSDRLTGILCSSTMLVKKDSKICFDDSVKKVEKCSFHKSDCIIYRDERRVFLRSLDPGTHTGVIFVKEPMEIVRDIFAGQSTWIVFKQAGKAKKDWKAFNDFIKTMDVSDMKGKISGEIECSLEEAEKYLQQFCSRVDEYINANTIEDEVLLAAIYSNDDLMKRCMELVTAQWQEENSELIKKEEQRRHNAQKQISEAEQKLSDINAKYRDLYEKQQELLSDMEEKQKLAEEVEEAVNQRIQNMKENASETLADITMLLPLMQSSRLNGSGSILNSELSEPVTEYRHINPNRMLKQRIRLNFETGGMP